MEENVWVVSMYMAVFGPVTFHEGLPLGCVGFEQTLLGPFQHKSQAVQSLPSCRRG